MLWEFWSSRWIFFFWIINNKYYYCNTWFRWNIKWKNYSNIILMDIYKYLKKEYPYFHDEILYFLNSQECIIFGGFVKSILINSKWNNELDVLCYNYKKTLSDFTKLFTPDSIEDIDIHTILHYGNYKIDLCNLFTTNDFSFN
ncbi:MAG: hypothetical protein EBR82_58770, partial [Caulobacteraceae bacterium]|nr:hypothetical protein [Caulobacteraceae bacterium]